MTIDVKRQGSFNNFVGLIESNNDWTRLLQEVLENYIARNELTANKLLGFISKKEPCHKALCEHILKHVDGSQSQALDSLTLFFALTQYLLVFRNSDELVTALINKFNAFSSNPDYAIKELLLINKVSNKVSNDYPIDRQAIHSRANAFLSKELEQQIETFNNMSGSKAPGISRISLLSRSPRDNEASLPAQDVIFDLMEQFAQIQGKENDFQARASFSNQQKIQPR